MRHRIPHLLALLVVSAHASAQENFLIIIGDDLGVEKIGAYGDPYGAGAEEAHTDNIDDLFANGVLFENAWSNTVCSPTRAMALVGKYGFRVEIGWFAGDYSGPPLDVTTHTTIPKMLESLLPGVDYATAAVGKWHMGSQTASPGYDVDHPADAGFDDYEGSLFNLGPQLDDQSGDPFEIGDQDYQNWARFRNGTGPFQETTYATKHTADLAVELLDGDATGDLAEPFFLWVAFNAPHGPLHVPPSSLYPDLQTALSDPPTDPEMHRAMTEAMDVEIGNIVAAIPTAVLGRTTIVFFGDNGTAAGAIESIDEKRGKGTVYEGGIRVPFIVRSPHVVGTNRTIDHPISVADIFATVAEIAGVTSPPATDSISFLAYLQSSSAAFQRDDDPVYAEAFLPNQAEGDGPFTHYARAIRDDQYKLIRRFGFYEQRIVSILLAIERPDSRGDQVRLLRRVGVQVVERSSPRWNRSSEA